jgi:hypothetical protein
VRASSRDVNHAPFGSERKTRMKASGLGPGDRGRDNIVPRDLFELGSVYERE